MITFDVYATTAVAKTVAATIYVRDHGDVQDEVARLTQAILRSFPEDGYMVVRVPGLKVEKMADLEVTIEQAVALGRLTGSNAELDAAIILSEKERDGVLLFPSYEAVEGVLRRFKGAKVREVQKGEKTAGEALQELQERPQVSVYANVFCGCDADYVRQDSAAIVSYLATMEPSTPVSWLEYKGEVYIG